MGKNKKKGILIISCLFVILLSIFLYPRKDDNKSIIKKTYAFKIKNNGETSYISVDTIPSDLTNYHIDEEKTICENGGKVSIVGNKLAYQTIGSDRCSVYLYYEEPHDININVANPSYLLGGYTKSITNCTGTNSATWDNKLNGLVISNWSDLVNCDISFTQKTLSSSELLTTIVNNKGTTTTHGIRYQGKNPDNYVWFNDELWRIIGNVPVCLTSGCASTENRVKLIRNDSIGAIKYNESDSSAWMGSNAQNLLNTCYLGKTTSCDSYCYSYSTSVAGTCDYSSDGIDESDYYGNMIENVYFNVGEGDGTIHSADDQYNLEISSYSSSSSKIGLMYASDYGYAIEGFSGVLGESGNLKSYMNKNWLFSNADEWTMTSYNYSYALSISIYGNLVWNYGIQLGYAIRPVLYLKSNAYVSGGTGSKVNPYTLAM